MATVTLSHLTDLVALKLDEFPDCRLTTLPGNLQTTLREILSIVVEKEAQRLTRQAALTMFTEVTDFRKLLRSDTDWGEDNYAELDLPPDFCRLHSFRLHGWTATLSEAYSGDTLRTTLGAEAPRWLASRPSRPWVQVICRGNGRTLRFGPPVSATAIEANYVALPRFDMNDEWLTGFDTALLPQLVDSLAEIAREKE